MVLEKQTSEVDEGRLDVSVRRLPSRNTIEVGALLFVQLGAVGQVSVTDVFPYDQLGSGRPKHLPSTVSSPD